MSKKDNPNSEAKGEPETENEDIFEPDAEKKPDAVAPLFKSSVILANAHLLENKIVVWSKDEANQIYCEKYFGKWIEEEKEKYLQLSLEEAMILLERGHIAIFEGEKKHTAQSFYDKCIALDKEFPQKFTVYKDLRNRGYIVKSGFKFGTHFRVYDRGVNPYKTGGKETKEHTKYNVHAYPENQILTPQEWSRYVRLSHNIRATALMAIVDEEGDVTYYKIIRTKP